MSLKLTFTPLQVRIMRDDLEYAIRELGFAIVYSSGDYKPGEVLENWQQIFDQPIIVHRRATEEDFKILREAAPRLGMRAKEPPEGFENFYRVGTD